MVAKWVSEQSCVHRVLLLRSMINRLSRDLHYQKRLELEWHFGIRKKGLKLHLVFELLSPNLLFCLMGVIWLVLKGNCDVIEWFSIYKLSYRVKQCTPMQWKNHKSNHNKGIIIIKLNGINQRRCAHLPGYPSHIETLAVMRHDVAHGDTWYATMSLKSTGSGARFRTAKSELKFQPALPHNPGQASYVLKFLHANKNIEYNSQVKACK